MEALFEKTKNHHFLFEVTDGPLPYCPTPWEKEAVPAANPDFAHLPRPPVPSHPLTGDASHLGLLGGRSHRSLAPWCPGSFFSESDCRS